MAVSSDTFDLNHPDPLTDGPKQLLNGDTPTNGMPTNTTNTTTTSSSTTPPSGPPNKAKSLSCGTCRERKVRCDKNQPCSTCQRAKVPCIFPSAKRLPRKRQGERKKTNEKLLQRLNRLEALVEKAGLDEKDEKDEKDGPTVEKQKESSVCTTTNSSPGKIANGDLLRKKRERSETSQSSGSQPGGKTALEGEMSRYLGSNFWANLSDEVEGLRLELNHTSEDDIKEEVDDEEPPPTGMSITPIHPSHQLPQLPSRNGFIFSFNVPKVDLRFLHPTPVQIETMCTMYVVNIDPLNRILHKPTLRKFITGAKDHLDTMPGGSKMQALMFAMYFAAITSSTAEECMASFGEERNQLLARYRFGTEQALVHADMLNSMEMVTLQALVIYLICIRCHDDSRLAWTLTSIAIRIAHALDLHRDDSFASLSPFNTEMRRRLWWQIIILDGRASEDRGTDPMITDQSYNTMMPSNVNDEDIDPDKRQEIVSREGYTEMTFCLICHEVSVTIRQLNYVPPGLSTGIAADVLPNQEEKERLVSECHERLESKYLQYCDSSVPLSWATIMVTRMIMARMWLIVHKPLQRQDGEMSPRNSDHERVLSTATEVIEYAWTLETTPCAERWRWFFGTWHQWYALAMALAGLCNQPHGSIADRAWKAVDQVFNPWAKKVADSQNGGLWRPIKKLRNKARAARDGKPVSDVTMTDDTLVDFNIGSEVVPPSLGDPLMGSMPDYPIASLETGTDGLLPSSNGSQGLLGTPLPHQLDLNQWAMNDPPTTPSQALGPSSDQFNWAGWDDFMRASQREGSSGIWGPQMGTWWQ
ncbi:MAG: hypothetical protein Q9209_004627 [Squamulea sp. 1 TL-2023]